MDTIFVQNVPSGDGVSLLYSCLSGLALDFFYCNVKDTANTLEEAFVMLKDQFNYFQHQSQSRSFLNSINISNVVKELKCTKSKALETIQERIIDVGPSCGNHYQADTHRQDFLANAVSSEEWATQTLHNRLTPSKESESFDYNTLYPKLSLALNLSEKGGDTIDVDKDSF